MPIVKLWGKGLAAAAIAGASNGMITGLAAAGIDPAHFNLQSGLRSTLAVAGASAAMSAIMAVAAYLKQSPLPSEETPLGQGDLDRGANLPGRK
jgi:hypothetical protein